MWLEQGTAKSLVCRYNEQHRQGLQSFSVSAAAFALGGIMPYAPLGLGVGIMAMPAMSACVGYLHIAISHKGVLSANAMSKVLA